MERNYQILGRIEIDYVPKGKAGRWANSQNEDINEEIFHHGFVGGKKI